MQNTMTFAFGPVPSRRLGRSLGIDTVPLKTCNWNCAYCQLGRSRPLVGERHSWYDPQAIIDDVEKAIKQHRGAYDWVTFVGSGEGTLHRDFGQLVKEIKFLSDKPVAVITNGSTLMIDDVCEGLALADAVMPTFDTAYEKTFRKLNRPRPELTLKRHLEGLRRFSSMDRSGKLCIEVMLVSGINDTEEELDALASQMKALKPDEIHIMLPTRCPAERWVNIPTTVALLRAQAILGERATLLNNETVAVDLGKASSPPDALAAIVERHPLRLNDAREALQSADLGGDRNAAQIIEDLCKAGRIAVTERFGVLFLTAEGLNHKPLDHH